MFVCADQFSVSPGMHLQDLSYAFTEQTPHPQAQAILQQAIASFSVNGTPVATVDGERKAFPHGGSAGTLVNLTAAEATLGTSKINKTRCAWWLDFVSSL